VEDIQRQQGSGFTMNVSLLDAGRPTRAFRHPRRSVLFAAFALLVVAGPALGQRGPCDLTAGAAGDRAAQGQGVEHDQREPLTYMITNSEKLAVRFHAYPELSGEYRINADNTISIPVIGRIRVEGMNAACLELTLARRATEIARRDVYVTVETVTYQPIYVTGAVSRPGLVPWAPGMTVLHAITMAGGRYRSTDSLATMDPVRANKSFDEQKRALVSLSRLRSERNERPMIEIEQELVRLVGLEEAKLLVAAQESLFFSRRTANENAIASLQRAMKVAREEQAALTSRQSTVDEQMKLLRAQHARLTDLRNKGIVIADRVMEQDFRLAQLDEKAIDNSVALARVGASLAGLERDLVGLKAGRMAEIDAEIGVQERILAQSRIEVRAAQAAGEVAAPRAGQQKAPVDTMVIVRRSGASQKQIVADEATTLHVGDTIIVSVQLH
jgi:protein involved in polysaccharide export with SLBB domain